MIVVKMDAEKREELGKQANKKIRDKGLVPAVIYGKGKDNVNISIDGKELKKVLSATEARENTILEISFFSIPWCTSFMKNNISRR